MVEERDMATALRRLAVLESSPLRTTDELLEWHALRQWVLENNLTEEYRSQHYFSCSEEVTKNEVAPKNPSSIFSRFLNLFRK